MLTPVQAWAVLDMGMQKVLVIPVSQMQESVVAHPCHQDGDVAQHSMDSHQAIEVSEDRCYSCTLCMAFALLPDSVPALITDRFTQTFSTSLKTLTGIDLSVANKPPIL
ncbi:hypothetical protein ICV32_06095 [Polynucleobacter sp. MWH-UH24A]|uniref:hypothetical protein n=1 Tax=Polynucleobacter sp. MWH-UH24A TaxID=2689110 RepID=UPI001BFE4880|nr:hypothetical protein [Polynucleobacter sp. MWH-UH24A]QWD75424.1 hypothetical protein ICV32_06095 [Polynucleobacter sp. MWH-UH24A]